jgi:uncharacterized membrane protein YoaK (UPF0700 family)
MVPMAQLTATLQRSRAIPPLIVGVYAITAICGMLDAASFLGLGYVFVEIMTGNLVYLAFTIGSLGRHTAAASLLPGGVYLPYVVALSSFAIGAIAGGRLVRLSGQVADSRIGFVVEWAAIAAATVVTALTHPGPTGSWRFAVFALLAFAMGIQNAMLRRWGISNLATNVMTLTMTALFADSTLGGGDNHHFVRRGTSIAIFFVSAGVGALILRLGIIWPVAVSFLVFSLAMPALLWGEKESDAPAKRVKEVRPSAGTTP